MMATEKRLIDANAMREEWLQNGENEYVYDTNAVLDSIDAQTTVDAVEVVHGRWNWISDSVVSCSNCERNFYPEDDVNAGTTWYYCPKCGARMNMEVDV